MKFALVLKISFLFGIFFTGLSVQSCERMNLNSDENKARRAKLRQAALKNQFDQYIKEREVMATKSERFRKQKDVYGITKWGEPIEARLKGVRFKIPTGICFDLSKVEYPWMVLSEEPLASLRWDALTTGFRLVANMDFFNLPHLIGESDTTMITNEDYFVVLVSGATIENNGQEILVGPSFSIDALRSNVDDSKIWQRMELPTLVSGRWSFEQFSNAIYSPNPPFEQIDSRFVGIDFSNEAFYRDHYWSFKKNYPANFIDGLPVSIEELRYRQWPMGEGRFTSLDKKYHVRFQISSFSTPRVAEVFDLIETKLESIRVPCE